MTKDRQELEKQLKEKAEAAIRKLLTNLPDKTELTMTDMEALIGEMGHEMMRDTMQAVAQAEQIGDSEVMCEACHGRMHKRGKRKRQVVTKRGEIKLERQYYVCPECGASRFPPR